MVGLGSVPGMKSMVMTLYCVDVVVEECDVEDWFESVSDLQIYLSFF